TRVTYAAKTSQTGVFSIPYVLPGTYGVTVSAQGFKTTVQNNVVLAASQTSGLNFRLQVGTVSQSVEVTSAAPLLNTVTGSAGTVLTAREIENLPLDGRQVYMLLGTTPGTQFTQEQFGASGFSGTRGWDVTNSYSIGGARQGYNMFTLNGANMTVMTGFGGQGSWMVAPNVDALQEINIQTNTYDARYGHTGGGTVTMVTKNGTNNFHGDAYEYLENGALNANRFDNNYSGVERPNAIQHQYGGTFGGPIQRDKAFFFGSFEGYWEDIPFTTLTSVPPAYLRPQQGQGVNFTQTGYTIYDPTTTVCTAPGGTLGNCPGNAYSRTAFANDTIPAGDINASGAALLNLFPQPNINVNSLQNNFITTTPDQYRYYQPMVRVDYNTSPNTRWYT
ncbi:MAG: carboxypeptidase regulatory-like domain-containing protein, partial [Gammaproteobacteria bacterium]